MIFYLFASAFFVYFAWAMAKAAGGQTKKHPQKRKTVEKVSTTVKSSDNKVRLRAQDMNWASLIDDLNYMKNRDYKFPEYFFYPQVFSPPDIQKRGLPSSGLKLEGWPEFFPLAATTPTQKPNPIDVSIEEDSDKVIKMSDYLVK